MRRPLRRPTDGDAAYQLRLALRSVRAAQTSLRRAVLDAMPRKDKVKCETIRHTLGSWVAELEIEQLIRSANQHVRQLRAAKRKAAT